MFDLYESCQQRTPSPASTNAPIGWLRAGAGSYKGKELPAFVMGTDEVNGAIDAEAP